MVEWCGRNPAYVGAYREYSVAMVCRRVVIICINSFGNGGVMAMLL
jgi:hypothetical protein